MHTHTADVLLVVLRGAYLYRDEAGAKRVGPGDFLRIPGGHKHWSGGDRKEGALFYKRRLAKSILFPARKGRWVVAPDWVFWAGRPTSRLKPVGVYPSRGSGGFGLG